MITVGGGKLHQVGPVLFEETSLGEVGRVSSGGDCSRMGSGFGIGDTRSEHETVTVPKKVRIKKIELTDDGSVLGIGLSLELVFDL